MDWQSMLDDDNPCCFSAAACQTNSKSYLVAYVRKRQAIFIISLGLLAYCRVHETMDLHPRRTCTQKRSMGTDQETAQSFRLLGV
jgi:hypothetical protein